MKICKQTLDHLTKCDECFDKVIGFVTIMMVSKAGSTKSDKKAKASRKNGKLGGRPKSK